MANTSNKVVTSSRPAVASKPNVFVKLPKFLKETWVELKKTSWPNQDELRKGTISVVLAVIVVAIFVGGLDYILRIVGTATLGK